jgi:hypothetical protein
MKAPDCMVGHRLGGDSAEGCSSRSSRGLMSCYCRNFFGECQNGLTDSRLLIRDSVGPLIPDF